MNKHIFNYLVLGGMALLIGACNDSESKLLESKVYFENKEYTLSMEDESDVMTFNLTSRLSTMASSQVDVSYTIADPSVVEEYNARYGTTYEMFDASHVKLSSSTSIIPSGKLYADNVLLELSNLEALEEGKSFILPVRVQSSSVPTLPGTSIAYFFLSKPIKITKVGTFSSQYISIKFPVNIIAIPIIMHAWLSLPKPFAIPCMRMIGMAMMLTGKLEVVYLIWMEH